MHKWRPKKYSFVFVLISLTSLVSTDEVQKKTSFRTRLVALINTKTKEYQFGRHFCIWSIESNKWARGDMEFLFVCSTRYLTSERSYQQIEVDSIHVSKREHVAIHS